MRILFFLSVIFLAIFNTHADDCLVSKRHKKQPIKELQMRVAGQTQDTILKCSEIIHDLVSNLSTVLEDKEELKVQSQRLDKLLTAMEIYENDVHLNKQKNKVLDKQPTLEGK